MRVQVQHLWMAADSSQTFEHRKAARVSSLFVASLAALSSRSYRASQTSASGVRYVSALLFTCQGRSKSWERCSSSLMISDCPFDRIEILGPNILENLFEAWINASTFLLKVSQFER